MAIYMKIPGINGDVSTKNYEKAIALHTMRLNTKRTVSFNAGRTNNRSVGLPQFSSVEIDKPIDESSNGLWELLLTNKAINALEIHCCNTQADSAPYMKYRLSNVLVTQQTLLDHQRGAPLERLCLNYTKIERTYIGYDNKHRPKSPMTSGFDLDKQEMS
jgi:type VI secretion system Hcp family effector